MKLEIGRQMFHLLVGVFIAGLLYFDVINSIGLLVLLGIAIILALIYRKWKIPVISWFVNRFERPENIKGFPAKGAIFFLIGILLSVKLFTKDIALASIMIVSLGDSVSHIFGRKFGKTKNPIGSERKKLEGTIAGIIAGFVGALVFVSLLEAFLASFIAMTVEAFDLPIDDNLLVPLTAGTVIVLMRMLF